MKNGYTWDVHLFRGVCSDAEEVTVTGKETIRDPAASWPQRVAWAGILVLGVLLALGGCVPPSGVSVGYSGALVQEPPPPPPFEEPPPPPGAGLVWIPGDWVWSGGGYDWQDGYWKRPPRPGLYWHSGGWIQRGGGYARIEGRWGPPNFRWNENFLYKRHRHWAPEPAPRVERWRESRRYYPEGYRDPRYRRDDWRRQAPPQDWRYRR